jgi:hypothetical protein
MCKTVEIYLGFMEEEISPLLKSLLTVYAKIPVRAISRGELDAGKQLFEQAMTYYGVKDAKYFIAKNDSGKLGDSVAENLRSTFFEDTNYREKVVKRILTEYKQQGDTKNEREPKVSAASAALSVIYLDDNKVPDHDFGKLPICCYVVQSPEMGKQPSIVRAYLRAIFRAIMAAHEGAKVRVIAVGAGGGIPMGIEAGQQVKIGASIFIGVEIDSKGKLYGVVDIAGIVPEVANSKIQELKPLRKDFVERVLAKLKEKDPSTDGLSIPMFGAEVRPPKNTGDYDQIKVAQRLATAMVTGMKLEEIENITLKDDPDYGVKVFLQQWPLGEEDRSDIESFQRAFAAVVREIGRQYEEISESLGLTNKDYYRISASWSYFDQKAEKDAVWQNLGEKKSQIVANSNMEDYHVFRVLESMLAKNGKYPELVDFSTIRLTANPNASEKAIALLEQWLETKPKYTKEDWIESIYWGLQGCPTEAVKDLPRSVHFWKACWTGTGETAKSNDIYNFIFPVMVEGIPYALDPFCMDIAQDFLKELPEQYGEFFKHLNDKYKKKENDKWVINRDLLLGDKQEVVNLIGEFLRYNKGEYDAGDGLFYIWIRNKWNQHPKSKVLNGVIIKDHDRMLYRSGNVFAMRELPVSLTTMQPKEEKELTFS